MPTKHRRRHRGRRFRCACGEEHEQYQVTSTGVDHIRFDGRGTTNRKRATARPHAGEVYFFGDCGAGVALRFDGKKVVADRCVTREECDYIRGLPAPRVLGRYESVVATLTDAARTRAEAIKAELRRRSTGLVEAGVEMGRLLIEARALFAHGGFGVFLDEVGMERHQAFRAMKIAEIVGAHPAVAVVEIGVEKLVMVARLAPKQREALFANGVAANGQLVPLRQATARQVSAHIRSIGTRDPRGRKPKPVDPPASKLTARMGLPADILELFQAAQESLTALRGFAKRFERTFRHRVTDAQRLALRRLWVRISALHLELANDLRIGDLLDPDQPAAGS